MEKLKAEIKARSRLDTIKLDKIPQILKPGEVGATLELILKDNDGNITEHRGPMESKSFLAQFIEMLFSQFDGTPETIGVMVKDTGNVERLIPATYRNFDCSAGAGSSAYGIQVGSGSTSPTITDYKLETQIAHGVGAGQLQYGAVAFGAPSQDGSTSQFTITRDFANNSGGAVVVNEVGLGVLGHRYGANNYILIIRDVISGGISVPNGQTLTVNYREQAAV